MPPQQNPLGSDMSSQIFPQRNRTPMPPTVASPETSMPSVPPVTPVATADPSLTQVPPPPIQDTPTQSVQSAPVQVPPTIPPVAFQTNMTSPPHRGKGGVVVLILILLVLLGGVAYAYYEQLWFFAKPPYDTARLTSSIATGASKIKTASYAIGLKIASEPRDANARSYNEMYPQDTGDIMAYNRDVDRVRDISDVVRGLSTYYSTHKRYPSSLSLISGLTASARKVSYIPASTGADYTISVTFESTDAIAALKDSDRSGVGMSSLTGNTLTLNKRTAAYLYLPEEPSRGGILTWSSLQKYTEMIPDNFLIDGLFSGASYKREDGSIDGRVAIVGTGQMGDASASVDLEFRKVGDEMYGVLNKFPSFLSSYSAIKGKWIHISSSDVVAYGSGFIGWGPRDAQKKLTKAREQSTEQLKLFLELADKHQALQVAGTPVREDIDGVSAYKYDLQFNKATLADFYQDLATQFSAKWGPDSGINVDQALVEYLNSPEFDTLFDYMRTNTTLTLWARADGVPIKSQYSIRIVPDSSANAKNIDTQIRLIVTLSLSDINTPISIEAPTESMNLEDATIMLTGQSREEYRFSKQAKTIQSIRRALSDYHYSTGRYPTSLAELTKTRAEVMKSADDRPFMATVPTDLFTQKAFGYTTSADDYQLSYTMQYAPYQSGSVLPDSLYTYDYSVKMAYGSAGRPLLLVAVQGTNTATSKVASTEAVAQSKIDTDNDSLPDALENYMGTNRLKTDTDGDGRSDREEFDSGSDPRGPGKLKTGNSRYGY